MEARKYIKKRTIRELRRYYDVKVSVLAKYIGYSIPNMYKIETGQRRITVETLNKIIRFFKRYDKNLASENIKIDV